MAKKIFKIFKGAELVLYNEAAHDSYKAFFDALNKIIEPSLNNKIEFIWLDLAALFIDESFEQIFKYDGEENNYIPRVFIGSQKIEDFANPTSSDYKYLQFKRIFQLDHSIWTYYIPLQEGFEEKLKNVIEEIKENYSNSLYSLSVTHEYFETFTRLCKQNYLKGGHSSQVIPFLFSSKTLAIKKFNELEKNKHKQTPTTAYTLNVLLVDDFGNKPLAEIKKSGSGSGTTSKSKLDLIKRLWDRYYGSGPVTLNINCLDVPEVKNLNDILENGCPFVPDIILLDYNFSNDANTAQKNGIDFFKDLVENNSLPKGPFNKYWIIPISAFNNAFIDELKLAGHSFTSEIYSLSRGADLVSTPASFFYSLTKMVFEIIDRALKSEEDIKRVIREINIAKKGECLQNNSTSFLEQYIFHIKNKRDTDSLVSAEHGILKSIKQSINNIENYKQKIFYYEQLLYNLAFRNYPNNEEIIIFHDLLKTAQ